MSYNGKRPDTNQISHICGTNEYIFENWHTICQKPPSSNHLPIKTSQYRSIAQWPEHVKPATEPEWKENRHELKTNINIIPSAEHWEADNPPISTSNYSAFLTVAEFGINVKFHTILFHMVSRAHLLCDVAGRAELRRCWPRWLEPRDHIDRVAGVYRHFLGGGSYCVYSTVIPLQKQDVVRNRADSRSLW